MSHKTEIFQFDLYARHTDPVTSHEAQWSMSRSKRRVQLVHIMARFDKDRPLPLPMTSFDVAEYIPCAANNISNYFKPLELHGYLKRVGYAPAEPPKKKRRGLWILTNKARRFCNIPERH
jgi:hypothetical protein